MKQESERLQRYGLENEAVEKLLHEVIVNNEDECKSILKKLLSWREDQACDEVAVLRSIVHTESLIQRCVTVLAHLFSFKPKQR
jgi:hypothetical protein